MARAKGKATKGKVTKPKAKTTKGTTRSRRIQKPKADLTKQLTYITILLDRSGSMQSVQDATILGFNQQIEQIKASASETPGTTFVNLVTFASTVLTPMWHQRADRLTRISRETYQPNGGTALNDAIGYVISRTLKEVPEEKHIAHLVVILTDGEENSSTGFSGPTISHLIRSLERTGQWTFTVAGANIDLKKLQAQTGIAAGNTVAFAATEDGVQHAFGAASLGTSSYLRSRSLGQTQTVSFYSGNQGQDALLIDTQQAVKPTRSGRVVSK